MLQPTGKFGNFPSFTCYKPGLNDQTSFHAVIIFYRVWFKYWSVNMTTFPDERVCDRNTDCSHHCHDAPTGSICYCPSHLHLQPDKMTCLASHPCEAWGVCSQLCQPLKYGHKCLCEEGYKLQHDGFTCKSIGNVSLTLCLQLVLKGHLLVDCSLIL